MKLSGKSLDEHLVLQCRAGQRSAFALLVERWHQKLCKQAYFHTKNMDVSKDIAQDSWTVIFTKLDQLKSPENFGSWALSIANRKAIDTLRKQNRIDEKLRDYQLDHAVVHQKEELQKLDGHEEAADHVVLEAVKNLPITQQQVIRLFYLEQYSLSDISVLLGLSKGTVKSRLFYAREKLKEIIKNRNHEK